MNFDAQSVSRRRFVRTAAVTGAAWPIAAVSVAPANAAAKKRNPICAFTKPLQSLDFDELADRMADMGFDGIEATVRDGGHIEPARAEDELPKMVEALRRRGSQVTILASSIHRADEPHAESTLRTAARLGIKHYRMKYYRYDLDRPILPQLEAIRPALRDLAALNRELGITALYHNHAGAAYVGAPLWDVQRLLDGVSVDEVAVGFDIRHATVEGGQCWPVQFRLLRPHFGGVFIKDFRWDGPKVRNVPLGQGWIDRRFFSMLKESDYDGPISLHEEYLDHRDPALVPEHLAAMKRDLHILRNWLFA